MERKIGFFKAIKIARALTAFDSIAEGNQDLYPLKLPSWVDSPDTAQTFYMHIKIELLDKNVMLSLLVEQFSNRTNAAMLRAAHDLEKAGFSLDEIEYLVAEHLIRYCSNHGGVSSLIDNHA